MNYNFECGKIYRIRLSVEDDCNNTDEMIKFVTIKCITTFDGDLSVELAPNPGRDIIIFKLTLGNPDHVTVRLYEQFSSNLVGVLKNQEWMEVGLNEFTWNASFLNDGVYFVQVQTPTSISNTQLYIGSE